MHIQSYNFRLAAHQPIPYTMIITYIHCCAAPFVEKSEEY